MKLTASILIASAHAQAETETAKTVITATLMPVHSPMHSLITLVDTIMVVRHSITLALMIQLSETTMMLSELTLQQLSLQLTHQQLHQHSQQQKILSLDTISLEPMTLLPHTTELTMPQI